MRTSGTDGKGGFKYSLFTTAGAHVETVEGFTTHTEADRAGERAVRLRCGFAQPCSLVRAFQNLEAEHNAAL